MSTGAICVNTLKKDWTAETTFSHVLSVIRCLLIVPFPESSLNDEAGKLFMESYDEYSKRAHLMADVHGRPRSTAESDEKRRKTDKLDGDNEDEESGSPTQNLRTSESANPLGSKNSNKMSSKSLGSKSASGKLKKKKSLKRL
jgi:ubiquitin-conjugating enzyme E2 S